MVLNQLPISGMLLQVKATSTVVKLCSIDVIIIFLPTLIFFMIFIIVFNKLKKDGVTLKELLLDKDMQVAIKVEETKQKESFNATAASLLAKGIPFETTRAGLLDVDATTPTDPPTSPKGQQSVSRLLAFISGLVSVGLASCITSFYILRLSKGQTVDFTGLVNVLLVLGMGVVPYAFNKISNAFK